MGPMDPMGPAGAWPAAPGGQRQGQLPRKGVGKREQTRNAHMLMDNNSNTYDIDTIPTKTIEDLLLPCIQQYLCAQSTQYSQVLPFPGVEPIAEIPKSKETPTWGLRKRECLE